MKALGEVATEGSRPEAAALHQKESDASNEYYHRASSSKSADDLLPEQLHIVVGLHWPLPLPLNEAATAQKHMALRLRNCPLAIRSRRKAMQWCSSAAIGVFAS
jgi:hypothetical protein